MAKIVILYKQLTDNEYEIMTEKEKMLSGEWYDAASDPELLSELYACRDRIYELNRLHPRETATRDILLRSIIGHMGREVTILSPFFCDYGSHISIGDCTYINFNRSGLQPAHRSPSTRRPGAQQGYRESPAHHHRGQCLARGQCNRPSRSNHR